MLTLANGAAIALRQGEFMVCRARSGATAPVLGARLDAQSGLSGECVRSARALVCDDTENDPRVNLDVCRYLGIRSIAVLPISLGREVVGVFEAFSAQPHGFSGNEVAALESMRDLVISVIRPSPQPQTPAASPLSARAAEDKPAAPYHLAEKTSLAPFSPAVTFDPEDDLLCELEQRAQPQPPSDPRTRAVQLLKAETPPPSPPPSPAPFVNPDPEDDLICEIEMHSAPWPLSEPYHAPALHGFAPAPLNLREPLISRKLIAFAVVVVLSGVIWLRWCNHAPRAAKNAAPSATVEAASAPLPGPAAPPVASKPETTPPVALASNPAQAAESAPALDAGSPAVQPPTSPPPPEAQERREHPARISRPGSKPPRLAAPSKSQRASLESVTPMSSAPASAAPVNTSSLPAPLRPTPAATQHQALPPVSAPPQVSPPAFTLRPSPPVVSQSLPPGQLSLSQAVVTSAPQSSHADALSPDALRLLLDSAAAGDAGAQLALAVRYADGEGVHQSYPEALKWFNKARAQGVKLSPGRVAEAWSKVQQWAQSHPEKR